MSAQVRFGGGGGIQIVGYEGSQFPARVAVGGNGGPGVAVIVAGRGVGGTRVRVGALVEMARVETRVAVGGATVGGIGVVGAMVAVALPGVIVRWLAAPADAPGDGPLPGVATVGLPCGIARLSDAEAATAVDVPAVLVRLDCGLEHATAPLTRRAAAIPAMTNVRFRTESGMRRSRRISQRGVMTATLTTAAPRMRSASRKDLGITARKNSVMMQVHNQPTGYDTSNPSCAVASDLAD